MKVAYGYESLMMKIKLKIV